MTLRPTSWLASTYQQIQMSSPSSTPTTLSTESTALATYVPNSQTDKSARRQQIGAACKSCQVRKGKCDGQRPCRWCRDREETCEYEMEAGETRTSARKRKHEDLKQEYLALLGIVDIAALRPDAGDILQQLKSGREVRSLLGSLTQKGEDNYAELGVPGHVQYHSRSGCDVLQERAVEWGRGVTGQGDMEDVDDGGREVSRRFYPEIIWPESGYD